MKYTVAIEFDTQEEYGGPVEAAQDVCNRLIQDGAYALLYKVIDEHGNITYVEGKDLD